jgi:hypothetical protein
MQPLEIEVAAIHHIEGAGLWSDIVQDVHVRSFSIRNLNESRDGAAKVQQCVHLDGGLGCLELGPRKEGQAQIDRGGIQSIDGTVKVEAERLGGVQRAGDTDEDLGEIGIDPPVMSFIGIGKSGLGDASPEAHVVQLVLDGTQAGLDVAEAFAIGELSEAET